MENITQNINQTGIEQIGGLIYILKYASVYIPYTTLSLVGFLVGLFGNFLVIGSIITSKKLRNNSTCLLCLNLAFADLVITIFVNLMTFTGAYMGKKFFDERKQLCHFIGAACIIGCAASLVTMGFMALNRYICIYYHVFYVKYFTIRNTHLYCLLAWVLAFLIDSPNLLGCILYPTEKKFYSIFIIILNKGVGDHVYDTKTLQCIFDRLKVIYSIFFSVFAIYIPCIAIGFFYAKIFWYSYSAKKRIIDNHGNGGANNSSVKRNMEAVKVAKSLFSSFFLFSICWIPIATIFIVGLDDKLPMAAHAFTNLPAHLNSAINPIFYAVFNPTVREGYKYFLNRITCNFLFKTIRMNGLVFTQHSGGTLKTNNSTLGKALENFSKT